MGKPKDEMQQEMKKLITEQVLGPHGWVYNGQDLRDFSFLNARNFTLEQFGGNRYYIHFPNDYVLTADINTVMMGSIITIGLNTSCRGMGDMKYNRCFNSPQYIVQIQHTLGKFTDAGIHARDFNGYLQIAFDVLIDPLSGLVKQGLTQGAGKANNPITHREVKYTFKKIDDADTKE